MRLKPIVWTEPWYTDAHNNIRHAHLLSRFTLVDPLYQYRSTGSWQGRAHHLRENQTLIGRLSRQLMGVYWQLYAKKLRTRITFRNLNRKYKMLFCTSDHLYQIDHFDGPVVVDDDDPLFNDLRINLLNKSNVATVVTTTKKLKTKFVESGLKRPCKVIPSGLDLSKYSGSDNGEQESAGNLKNNDRVVGYMVPRIYLDSDREVANSAERSLYSISFLIDVMNVVWDERSDVQLWLIGKPSRSVSELAGAEPRIRLIGYIEEEHIDQYIRHFDIAAYPRPVDLGGRQSIKLLQFMASGVPIVSTDVAEAQVVKESGAGLLASDRSEFASAINHILESRHLQSEFSRRGKAYSKQFSWDEIASKYETEIFLPILDEHT